MTTAFYIIWTLIPLFFFLMALWSLLEKHSGKKKHERPGDFFKQGLFVAFCVLISILIDQYLMPQIVDLLVNDAIPYSVFQFVLLPFVLFVGAKIIGPTRPIQISRPPGKK